MTADLVAVNRLEKPTIAKRVRDLKDCLRVYDVLT